MINEKSNAHKKRLSYYSYLLIIALFLLSGCGEKGPTEPEIPKIVVEVIDETGGTIVWGDVTVEIPANAISSAATFTLQNPEYNPADSLDIDAELTSQAVLITTGTAEFQDTIYVVLPAFISSDIWNVVGLNVDGIWYPLNIIENDSENMRVAIPPQLFELEQSSGRMPKIGEAYFVIAGLKLFVPFPEAVTLEQRSYGFSERPVFVLIHGILADGGRWKDELIEPLSNFGEVWVMGYPWQEHFEGVAADALALINHLLGSREVYFICHSKGGLLGRAMIRLNETENIGLSIRKALFFATPHFGAPGSAYEVLVRWRFPVAGNLIIPVIRSIDGIKELYSESSELAIINQPLEFSNQASYKCIIGDVTPIHTDPIVPVLSADLAHQDHIGKRENATYHSTFTTAYNHLNITDYHEDTWAEIEGFLEVSDCEVVVNYPHSETTFYIGGQHSIDITPNTCDGDVRLELYKGSQRLCPIADISGRWYEWYSVSDCGGGPGTDYRIKATCLSDTDCYDFSDYFTMAEEVSDCEVVVNYPHSETTFYIGGQHSIDITPNTCDGDVRLELYKGSQRLCPIADISGRWYEWYSVSDCGGGPGTDYRIKATCLSDTDCYDFSDYFTMAEEVSDCEVVVNYPHSETTFYIGGQHSIDITPNTCDGDVRLELYKGSQRLCPIADISGRWYEWYSVSDCGGGPGTDYRIKATCLSDTDCYDFSDYFTMAEEVSDCEVVVNYPHSETTFYIGGQHSIDITPNTCDGDVRLELYKGSQRLCPIADISGRWYEWYSVSDCGGGPGTDYRIKATCLSDTDCYDFSDYFTMAEEVSDCEVVVNYPHSETTFYIGGQHSIDITPNTCDGDVRLELYKGSQRLCPIADISGRWYEWYSVSDCGGGPGTDYRIKATCLSDTDCYDFSDYFTMAEEVSDCEVVVNYPHSETTFYIGGQHSIDITPNTCDGDVRLELYKGSQRLCPIADISGRWYEWYSVSDCGGGPGTDYRIKATCLSDTDCYDFSDYFTISN